jgi:hypothetical protein
MTLILAANLPGDGGRSDDPGGAKALVMAACSSLVEEGSAVMSTLKDGTLELRLASGEIFHLGEETIARIA